MGFLSSFHHPCQKNSTVLFQLFAVFLEEDWQQAWMDINQWFLMLESIHRLKFESLQMSSHGLFQPPSLKSMKSSYDSCFFPLAMQSSCKEKFRVRLGRVACNYSKYIYIYTNIFQLHMGYVG